MHLKNRQSYLEDSYIGRLQNAVNENFDNAEKSQIIDEDAVVEGMWEDAENIRKSDRAESVENSQLESVENVDESGIIKEPKVLTLDDLTKDVLKTKPPHSRIPKDWIEAGGSIAIDEYGN